MANRKRGRRSRPASEAQRRAAQRGAVGPSEVLATGNFIEYGRQAAAGSQSAQRLLIDMARALDPHLPELREWLEPFQGSDAEADWPYFAAMLERALERVPEPALRERLAATQAMIQMETRKALGHSVMAALIEDLEPDETLDALDATAQRAAAGARRLIDGQAGPGDVEAAEAYLTGTGRPLDGDREKTEGIVNMTAARSRLTDETQRRIREVISVASPPTPIPGEKDRFSVSYDFADESIERRIKAAAARAGQTTDEWLNEATTWWLSENKVRRTSHAFGDLDLISSALAVGLLASEEHAATAGKVGIPLPEEGEGAVVNVPIAERHSGRMMWMPTVTVRRFSEIADEEGLPGALTEEERRFLAPDGRHVINGAQIVQGRNAAGERRHYVRVTMILAGRDGSSPEREVGFPVRQFGAFMDAIEGLADRHAEMHDRLPERVLPRGIEEPRWIGSRSFHEVWRRATELGNLAVFWSKNRSDPRSKNRDAWADVQAAALSPRALVAIDALERMQQARVLAVDVDVFEGAPEWDGMPEAFEWAAQARLPFDPIYLDLTTAGGLCPLILAAKQGGGTVTVKLHGALVWHDGAELTVLPVGWPDDMGGVIGPTEGPRDSYTEWDFLGRVTFGGELPDDPLTYRLIRANDPTVEVSATVPVYRPPMGLTGRVEVLQDLGYDPEGEPERDHDLIADPERLGKMWATLSLLCAGRVLSVLGMLEAMNVEVGDPKPTNEDRRTMKRAMKRGWPVEIAKTVMVRPSKAAGRERREGEGEKRVYSHAHWRRGHYAFYPLGTRIADKLAEENPSDARLVNHPEKGLCRKVYRGPVIVGAEGEHGERRAPVEKTRVWRKQPKPRRSFDINEEAA